MDLDALIEVAREWRKTNPVSPEEHLAQVLSFAYGNCRLENDKITKEGINKANERTDT